MVVGAGTAGAHVAGALARNGRAVALVDRRSPARAGARWCNGILPWQFERAGLALPSCDEVRGAGGAVHLLSPGRNHRVTVPVDPVWDVDVGRVGDRLRAEAEAAGVAMRWQVTDPVVHLDGDRPVEVVVRHEQGDLRLRAALFVDAAGRHGVIRRQVPALARFCPPLQGHELCSAQQFVHRIEDREGARRFLDAMGAQPGDAVDWIGPSGGWSAIVIRVGTSLDEVSVLAGTIADGRFGTGRDLLRRTLAEHRWIGPAIFGGAGLIPLRRTFDRLVSPGLALVGDAGSQVMAAHGSGTGFGLIGGTMLAESVAGALDPGAPDVLRRYESGFHRRFGATIAAADVFRRMSVAVGSEGVEALFSSGLFGPSMAEGGLRQELVTPRVSELPSQLVALLRSPSVSRTLLPTLARAAAAQGAYRVRPDGGSEWRLQAWQRAAGWLLD